MNIGSLQPSLSAKADTGLAAYIGPLDAEQQLNSLVVAWSYVVTRRPSARLWFVGDGPGAEQLSEQIRRHECHRDMLITGWFDNLDDVYAAVDLVIVPQPTPHPCRFVLGAMARGRPVLYRHKQRNWMSERKWGIACPGRNSLEFAQAIGNALERSTTGQPTDEVPVASIRDRHELQSQARKFRDICCQLIARKVHVETR